MSHDDVIKIVRKYSAPKTMKYIRVTSREGGRLLAEHLYYTDSLKTAIDRFIREYPEHEACEVTAEPYNPKVNREHFMACVACGCVH